MNNEKYSTTRMLTMEKPNIVNNMEDKFDIVLFLPEGENRKGEGGLRTKGYFKKSFENKPLVTIVTVTYNSEQFLEDTIQSVLNQTYDNIEYIVIDGGSTDKTLDILKRYKDAIDYFVSEPDNGMYDALNKGFSVATGVLINFCNSDDLFHSKEIIKKIIKEYNQENFDCCYGGTEYIDNKNNTLYYRYPLGFKLRYLVTLGMPFAQPTFFWTKKLMMETGLFDLKYKIASDYDLIGKLLFNAKKIHRIQSCMIKFRKHGDSFGDQNTNIALKETLEIKKGFINQLELSTLLIRFYSLYDRIVQKLYQIVNKLLKK